VPAKKNLIKEGLKTDKKLKEGFYHFIYEKNLDWAIIFGAVFVIFPYIASKNMYFLISKILLVCGMFYLIGKYLLTWNQLRKFKEEETKFKESMKSLITPGKTKDSTKILQELTNQLTIISEKAAEKAHLYKNLQDYIDHEKSDFQPIVDLINEDPQAFKTSIGTSLSILTSLLTLREIPNLEKRNYLRLIGIMILVLLFFILYYFEVWFT